jgi:hypothetical protein
MRQVVLKQFKKRFFKQESTILTVAITVVANATKDEPQEEGLLTFPLGLEEEFNDGCEHIQNIQKRITLLFDFLTNHGHQFCFSLVQLVHPLSTVVSRQDPPGAKGGIRNLSVLLL